MKQKKLSYIKVGKTVLFDPETVKAELSKFERKAVSK